VRFGLRGVRSFALLALVLAAPLGARADWLMPDPTFRDAQFQLRSAIRDTVGRAQDAGRLDTLGLALLRLGHEGDADAIYRRVLALAPGDIAAKAGLGKLALFADRTAEAETLLAAASSSDEGAMHDLYACKLRVGDWLGAAAMAEDANEPGRVELLKHLAEEPPFKISGAPQAKLMWVRAYPVPLVKVKLNGESVLMGVDTGAGDLLIDPMWASRGKVQPVPGQSQVFWCGSRCAT
jgi:hypothetical protein